MCCLFISKTVLCTFYVRLKSVFVISLCEVCSIFFFFFQAEDGIRDHCVTGVQTCALPISIVPVDINAASAVEHRSPVVRSVQKLRRIGRIAPERRSSDIDVAGGTRAALCFIHRLPVLYSELSRRGPFPGKLPVPHSLFTANVTPFGD